MLEEHMRKSSYDDNSITVFKIAFYKFKVMAMLRPRYKMFYIYFWKNYLEHDSQLVFKRIKDLSRDLRKSIFDELLDDNPEEFGDHKRLIEYLYDEEDDWILPTSCLPLIDVDKGYKMYLSLLPYTITPSMTAEFRTLVSQYLDELKLEEVFMAPPDSLFKVGNQNCNDNGIVRKDRDHVSSIDSDFLYQRFITQPLTPREVWLPSKLVKYNNNFWMSIGKQVLRKDPIYPKEDIRETYAYLQTQLQGLIRFDLSGFGFQIPRELILIVAQQLATRFPSDQMNEHLKTLDYIFNKVKVWLPNGFCEKPTRGIGLGYYEDLKTIVVQSILKPYGPLSVYGDQGLFGECRGDDIFDSFDRLRHFGFIVEEDHLDQIECYEEVGLKWAGARMTRSELILQKGMAEPILGALFSSTHWERKNSLCSIFQEKEKEFLAINNRLIHCYALLFGTEFGPKDELTDSFWGIGINGNAPLALGASRSYKVARMRAPPAEHMVDVVYSTPFGRKVSERAFSLKQKKLFSRLRRRTYKASRLSDSASLDISEPLVRDLNTKFIPEKLIPYWADLLYLFHQGRTAGTITSGLEGKDVIRATQRCPYSKDPYRSFATGGYQILTPSWGKGYRSVPVETLEQNELSRMLMALDYRSHLYVKRGGNKDSDLERAFVIPHGVKRKVAPHDIQQVRVPSWANVPDQAYDEDQWTLYRSEYVRVMEASTNVEETVLNLLKKVDQIESHGAEYQPSDSEESLGDFSSETGSITDDDQS